MKYSLLESYLILIAMIRTHFVPLGLEKVGGSLFLRATPSLARGRHYEICQAGLPRPSAVGVPLPTPSFGAHICRRERTKNTSTLLP